MIKKFNLLSISRCIFSIVAGFSFLSTTAYSQEYYESCCEPCYDECEGYGRTVLLIGGALAAGALAGALVCRGCSHSHNSSSSSSSSSSTEVVPDVPEVEKLDFCFSIFITADSLSSLCGTITPFVMLPDNSLTWGDESAIDLNTDLDLGCICIEDPACGTYSAGVEIIVNDDAPVESVLSVSVTSSIDEITTELAESQIVTAEAGEAVQTSVEFIYCPDEG